jgi:drug/metabolite transporter (DMT)-like permease
VRPPASRARTGLAAGVLAVSFAAILIRLADAPPLAIAAWRLLLAGAVAAAFAALTRRAEIGRLPPRAFLALGAAGLALGLHFATWIASLRLTSVASSVALVTTQPVFVAVLSRVALGERTNLRTATGIALALSGSAIMAGGDIALGPRAVEGDALALLGAVAAALYFVVGRSVRRELSLGAYVGVVYPAAALELTLLALATRSPLSGFGGRTWLALGLLALVPQLLGHSLLNWSLRWLSGTSVAVAILAEPVVSTALAIPVLGERPRLHQLVGGGILLVGVALAALETAPAESVSTETS